MIICPKCGAKLPDWQTQCQFCQEPVDMSVHGHQRPGADTYMGSPKWVWGAYYGIAVYFMLEGIYDVITGALAAIGHGATEPTFFSYLGIVVGFFLVVFGAGLLARVEVVRGLMNVFCGLIILFGLLGLPGTVIMALALGPFGILALFMDVLRIGTAGFMIYLIGETDRYAPNL